jgi:hypothetical protein
MKQIGVVIVLRRMLKNTVVCKYVFLPTLRLRNNL